MIPHPQNQADRLINVFSLNSARKNDVAHDSLRIASQHPRNFDIILHQEPWWGNISARDKSLGEARAQGWDVLLPVIRIQEEVRRPRVLTYVRKNSDFEIVQRTDIIEDYDIQILDIRRQGALQRTVRLINIYNVPEGGANFAVDRLGTLHLDPLIPTIITGDWNTKHPRFCAPLDRNPSARSEETVEWLDTNGFHLRNEWNQETWRKYGETQTSALDLTFQNNTAIASNILLDWTVDATANAGSDHYATMFTLGGGEEEIVNITEAKYNWKGMDKIKFTESLSRHLHANATEYEDTFGPLKPGTTPPTPTQVEKATNFLLECMTAAAEEAVPERRASPRAKPWWTKELSQARENLNSARAHASERFKALGHPDPEATQSAKHYAAVSDRLYKKTKRRFYEEVARNAGPHNFWDMRKWTNGARQYPTPPINRGEGTEPALTHKDKCTVLREKLLPPPRQLPNPPIVNLEPHPDDIPWIPVTMNEVQSAILGAEAHNAPGISGMTGAAYHEAWKVASNEIHWILSAAANIGFHPKMFRRSICVVLRKPKKPDYTLPKAYRPIQLLEVLGKALERIQGNRLSHYAIQYDMIPPLHFGGIKGKSAEDAILCAVHDIQAAHNRGLVLSSMTFDISGFFNNVSHPVLISKLRDLRLPLPFVKWTTSFLSDRETAMCLDGKRGDLEPTITGLPQGSPFSPPATGIYTSPLTQRLHDEMAIALQDPELQEEVRRTKATAVNLIIYVDDGKLSVASTSIQTNIKLLIRAYQVVRKWMEEVGLSIDPEKRELIHHTRRNKDYMIHEGIAPAVDTPVIIPASDGWPEDTIPATRDIKWLGVIFDNKLKFTRHLKEKAMSATKAVNSLSMIGNSLRGIHQTYRRHIIQGAILPMVTYASTAWWNGTAVQANILEKVQNRALRWITGAFRTTPVYATQIEASMPPIRYILDFACNRKCAALAHLHQRHPLAQRLPPPLRSENIRASDGVLIEQPHRGIGRGLTPERVAERMAENAKSTSLYKIAQQTITNTEHINRFLEPPWHRADKRVTVHVPAPTAGKSMKKRWARRHRQKMKQIEQREDEIAVYTDGSLRIEHGVRYTGAGVVGYQEGIAQFQTRFALGCAAEVYDAEMEGLARGAEMVRHWLYEKGQGFSPRRIWFFADNTGAIQRIYKGTPGYDQECSYRFRNIIHYMLDAFPNLEVNIEWVPGHHGIEGNDTADTLAKRGSSDEPTRAGYSTAAFVLNTHRKTLRTSWQHDWEADPNRQRRSDFRTANHIPPTINPTERFSSLSRKTFSRLMQCRTGHGHIGSYYDYFEIPEPMVCDCGTFQTRNHILLHCNLHVEHRHILEDNNGTIKLQKVLGTPEGTLRLAAFIEATNAFDKTPEA